MKKVYRAHPLMAFNLMKPFLFVLVLPFLRGVLQYLTDREVTSVLGIELILFGLITLIGVLRCHAFRLIISGNSVTVQNGLLFTERATIKISQLSSVQSNQNPLDAICRAVTYSINTEAGRKNQTDFTFKLWVKDSREISTLLYGDGQPKEFKFSVLKVAVLAATTSSAFTGLIIGVPIINKMGNLLGMALDRMLLYEINNASNQFSLYFPPIINVVTIIFLLGYSVSFIYSFLKYINFRLFLGKNKLEVRSGFFTRTRTSFSKDAVNDVRIEQTALMLLIKRYAMKVSIGGYGDSKSESEVIVPSGRHGEIKRGFAMYFPFLEPDGRLIHAARSRITKNRFLFWPALWLIVLLIISPVLVHLFTDFGRVILFVTLIALALIFCYAYICLVEYKFGKIRLGDTVFAHSKKMMRTCELYCPKENVGEIKITRIFKDFKYNTCRVKITVRSESADSIRVRMLNYADVKSEIYKCYRIHE